MRMPTHRTPPGPALISWRRRSHRIGDTPSRTEPLLPVRVRIGTLPSIAALVSLISFSLPWGSGAFDVGLGPIGGLSIIGMSACALAAFHIARCGWRNGAYVMMLLVLALTFWAWASVMWATDYGLAVTTVFELTQALVLVGLLSLLTQGGGEARWPVQAYVWGCIATTVALGWQLWTHPTGLTYRLDGFGRTANDLALVLIAGGPLAGLFALRTSRVLLRCVYVAFVCTVPAVIMLTGSRGVAVALLAQFIVVLGLGAGRLPTLPTLRKRWARIMPVTLLAGAGMFWISKQTITRWSMPFDRITSLLEGGVADIGGRERIWRVGWDAWLESPFLGSGAGAMRTLTERATAASVSSHNTPLGMLVELGLPGLVLFALMWAAALWCTWRLHGPERVLVGVSLIGIGVGMLSLSLETNRMLYFMLLIPWLLASPAEGASRSGGETVIPRTPV